ncbi:MAG: hypothetical protein ACOZAQ_08515 [Pseudomonadota bacterium]
MMHRQDSRFHLIGDTFGKCFSYAGDTAASHPDTLASLGAAMHRHASQLGELAGLGRIESIELHLDATHALHIEPPHPFGLTMRLADR